MDDLKVEGEQASFDLIESYIEENEIESCIKALRTHYLDEQQHDTVTLINSRYNALKTKRYRGLLKSADESRELNEINQTLLSILREMKKSDYRNVD